MKTELSALLFAMFGAASGSSTDRITRRECLPMKNLEKYIGGEVCIGYSLATCGDDEDVEGDEDTPFSLLINVTIGDQVVLDEDLSNVREELKCINNEDLPAGLPTGGETCTQTCFAFDKLIVKPAYARLCPRVVERCKFGSRTIDLPLLENQCQELGNPCEGTSCEECADNPGCGWCSATNACVYGVASTPYCSSCPEVESFYTEVEQCNIAALKAAEEEEVRKAGKHKSVVAIVVVVIVLVLCGCVGLLWYRRRALRAKYGRPTEQGGGDGGFSTPVELDDDDEPSYSDVPGQTKNGFSPVTVHTGDDVAI